MRVPLILCAVLCNGAYAFEQQEQSSLSKSLTFQSSGLNGASFSFQYTTGATTDLLIGSTISVFDYTRESPAYTGTIGGGDSQYSWEQGTSKSENHTTNVGLWIGQRHLRHRGTSAPYLGYGIGPRFSYTKSHSESHFPSDTPRTSQRPSDPRRTYGLGVTGFGSFGVIYKIRDNVAFQGDYSLVYSDDGILRSGNSVRNRITLESRSSVGMVLYW